MTEIELIKSIQERVANLPWEHKVNLAYFDCCIHEAAHATTTLIYMLYREWPLISNGKLIVEVNLRKFEFNDDIYVSGKCGPKGYDKNHPFRTILGSASGVILSDEFYHYYYGYDRIKNEKELVDTYGGELDFERIKRSNKSCLKFFSKLILRLSYWDSLVRLVHLRIINDLLINNGRVEINFYEFFKL